MSIVSIAGKSEQNSEFYLKFKATADELNTLSKEFNFKTQGEFNSYFLEYELHGFYKRSYIEISSYKKLKTVSTGLIPADSTYQQNTNIRVKIGQDKRNAFTLVPKSNLNRLFLLINGQKKVVFDDFIVYSKHKKAIESLSGLQPHLSNLKKENLVRIDFLKVGHLRFKFLSFFKNNRELLGVLNAIIKLNREYLKAQLK